MSSDLRRSCSGRDVAARAANGSGPAKQPEARPRFLGDGKVNQLDVALLVRQKIIGLDITVNPAPVVHVCQPLGRSLDDPLNVEIERFRPLAQFDLEVAGGKELHRDEGQPELIVEIMNPDHVGVIHGLRDRSLMLELADLGSVLRVRLRQDLERDPGFIAFAHRFPDLGRLAGADQPQELKGTEKITSCYQTTPRFSGIVPARFRDMPVWRQPSAAMSSSMPGNDAETVRASGRPRQRSSGTCLPGQRQRPS